MRMKRFPEPHTNLVDLEQLRNYVLSHLLRTEFSTLLPKAIYELSLYLNKYELKFIFKYFT